MSEQMFDLFGDDTQSLSWGALSFQHVLDQVTVSLCEHFNLRLWEEVLHHCDLSDQRQFAASGAFTNTLTVFLKKVKVLQSTVNVQTPNSPQEL